MTRIPWASLLLALVCLAGPLWMDGAPLDPSASDVEQSAREAAQFWRAHPHLQVVPQIRRTPVEGAPDYVDAPPGDVRSWPMQHVRSWAIQQKELDRLTRVALLQAQAAADEREESRLWRWGMVPGEPVRLPWILHLLVSPGWITATSHLLALALVAVALEARLGHVLFVALALGSALFGAAVHVLTSVAGSPPLVGTAGLVAGLLGGFGICLGRERIQLLPLPAGTSHRFTAANADGRLLLAGALAFELLGAWLAPAGDVARPYRAQLGGAVFGVVSLLGLRLPEAARRLRAAARARSLEQAATRPSLARGLAARDAGDFAGALRILELARGLDPRDPDLALAVWDTALMAKQAARGAPALAALVAHRVATGEEALALDHWLDLSERAPDEPVEPAALLRLVPLLQARGFADRAVQALRACVDVAGTLPAGLALRAADLARAIDPASARRAARRALEFPDLHEGKRERMRALLAELAEPPSSAPASGARPAEREALDDLDHLDDLDDKPRFAGLKLVEAVPVAIDVEVLRLQLPGGRKARVAYANVDAVAVAAVRGQGSKPVLLVDLLLNWSSFDEELLRVIRLRSSGFDPRSLFPRSATASDALRSLVDEILQRTGAMALPDVQAAYGRPFRVFEDLACYQREVLQVEG